MVKKSRGCISLRWKIRMGIGSILEQCWASSCLGYLYLQKLNLRLTWTQFLGAIRYLIHQTKIYQNQENLGSSGIQGGDIERIGELYDYLDKHQAISQ